MSPDAESADSPQMTLAGIAQAVHGRVKGNPDREVTALRSLASADAESITFFDSTSGQSEHLHDCRAAVILSADSADRFSGDCVIVDSPYLAYARLSAYFVAENTNVEISPSASIHADAKLGQGVSIGPFSTIAENVVIENGVSIAAGVSVNHDARIGENSLLEDRVVIGSSCRIGRRCTISAGAVIGASGFGYAADGQQWTRIHQLGAVVLGNDVDVGANTCIDRGALQDTIIGDGVKIDNLVQIAHNVEIGEHSILAGCVGIAGSARIGKRCKIGGRASILGHLQIVDDVTVLTNTVVTKNLMNKGEYASMLSAQPAQDWRRNLAVIKNLSKVIAGMKRKIGSRK